MSNSLPPRPISLAFLLVLWTALVPPGIAAGADDPAARIPEVLGPESWKDPAQPLDARVHDLVRRLSLEEKVSLMSCDAAAIPRLGIPAYSFRNECIHGVVGGLATVFPQVIGMAATWDGPLIRQEADVIATEARARHNDTIAAHQGSSGPRSGISFYAPNINIVRDPRWGRGQETYGEDPFLTAQMGVAFIRGLQGDNPQYVKVMACAKHFAVHSGPEPNGTTWMSTHLSRTFTTPICRRLKQPCGQDTSGGSWELIAHSMASRTAPTPFC